MAVIGSPTAGWLTSEMTSKHLLTISSTLGLLSSAVYAVAPAPFFVLISRLITGISAGMEFATELTFIAENTTTNERTTFLATVTAVNVLGFIMGPALGMLLSLLDINVFGYVVDQYTGPGWLLATMFTVDLIMVRRLFESDEIDMDHKADHKAPTSESVILLDHAQDLDNNDNSYGAISMRPKSQRKSLENVDEVQTPSLTLVLSMIFIQFTLMSGWSILETITSPLAQADFGWDMLQCNLLFTAGGAVSLLAYVIFVKVSKWVHDRWLVANALILCFIGFVLAIDWRQLNMTPAWIAHNLPSYLYRFIAGYFLMNAGFMTGRPVTFALYSKLIASESQGTHLGWMVAGGSAARTLGPFIAVRLFYGFERGGMNLLALFGSAAIFHLTSLTLVCLEWSNLLPKQEESSTARKRNSTASTDVEDCRFSSDDEIPEGVCHHRDQERATDRFC
jgi:MFS family permease